MPLLHIGAEVFNSELIILKGNKAMRFLNLLLHKLGLRQLQNAGKFRRGELAAHGKAHGAQAAALFASRSQHRMHRKVRHAALDV